MKNILIPEFQITVWQYYQDNGRHTMPWRSPEDDGTYDPYKIMLSEIMLQQTQVARVTIKYQEFLQLFPTMESLAQAPLAEVLSAWSGLGYNRRAKFVWQAAQMVVQDFESQFPVQTSQMVRLPGIGPNTAGAIAAYAFNQPVVFVETNIRTVFIHHFFQDTSAVPDSAIMELAAAALDTKNPRAWYWALMDYGSYIKQTVGNLSKESNSYTKQSTFEGSLRQIRGQALRILTNGPLQQKEICQEITDPRLAEVLEALLREQLIQKQGNTYRLG
jgi:A/G-specific adenine glycosylase